MTDRELLVAFVEERGPQPIMNMCRQVWRGTNYVRAIIDECDELVIVTRTDCVLDWMVDLKPRRH